MSRPPRIPNWLRWEKRTIYFITFCIESREPVLANAQAWTICRAVFDKLDRWKILSAIAMPDHLHILTAPDNRDASISDFSFESQTACARERRDGLAMAGRLFRSLIAI